MNYAVIDLGSNSIRLSVYECEDNHITKTFGEKEVAGLAGYVSGGVLDAAGIHKACFVVKRLSGIAVKFVDFSNIHVFASASLRNIKNRDEAVRIIAEETSLFPVVLEGHEEAVLGYTGVTLSANCDDGIMIDIGGASTELVLFKDKKAVDLVSLPIGCLNLFVKYVSGVLPAEKEWERIKTAIRDQFRKVTWDNENHPLMVGTGGTLRAALKLSRDVFEVPYEENRIQARYIKELIKLLNKNKDDIYTRIYKTVPERIMTIATGLAILQQAIRKFGCETISISKFGVREGYLIDRVLKANDSYVINQRN